MDILKFPEKGHLVSNYDQTFRHLKGDARGQVVQGNPRDLARVKIVVY